MPTGRIVNPGGVSSPSIEVPYLPGPPAGVRGATISNDGKTRSAGGNAVTPQPDVTINYGTQNYGYYAGIVPEVAKANLLAPSNQGRKMQNSFVAAMTPESANHSPSRSQFSEGYTDALQVFAASNTWQLAGPVDSPGSRAKQPSTKFVSPFSSLPIPTRMPWDL